MKDTLTLEQALPDILAGKEFRIRDAKRGGRWGLWMTWYAPIGDFNFKQINDLEFEIRREPLQYWVEVSEGFIPIRCGMEPFSPKNKKNKVIMVQEVMK